jgi:hypothetical protein
MQDYKFHIEKLVAEAVECELIGNLAVEEKKRATFRRLAQQFRTIGEKLRAEMEGESAFPTVSEQEFLLRNAEELRDLAATSDQEVIRAELLRMAADFERKAEKG